MIAVSDDAGAVMESFTYSPYGVAGGSSSGFPFRFTGQKLDPETGLYYYKARYYDPETGRFLQTDPIGYEDQMNLYAYVHNDPVNGIDPSGEESCPVDTCITVTGKRSSGGGTSFSLIGRVISFGDFRASRSTRSDGNRSNKDDTDDASVECAAAGYVARMCMKVAIKLSLRVSAKKAARRMGVTIRKDIRLSGGRSGGKVKDLTGPPNSAVRGPNGRVFITNSRGQVVRDVTKDRVKDVTPGKGFSKGKRSPSADELSLVKYMSG